MHVRMKSDPCHAASLWIFALMIAHWYDLRLWCFIEGHEDTGMALGVPPNGEVCFPQHQNCTARVYCTTVCFVAACSVDLGDSAYLSQGGLPETGSAPPDHIRHAHVIPLSELSLDDVLGTGAEGKVCLPELWGGDSDSQSDKR